MWWAIDPEGHETAAIHRLVSFDQHDVVEVGAGDGRLTWRYADHAASVLALDPVEALISTAQAQTPDRLRHKVKFRMVDVTVAQLPYAAFDIALLSWSIC